MNGSARPADDLGPIEARLAVLEWALESNPHLVFAADPNGRVLFVNAAARTRWGFPPDASVAQLLPALGAEAFAAALAAASVAGAAQQFAWGEQGTAGVRAWFSSTLSSLVVDRRIACYLCVSADVTGLKRSEERLRRSEQLMVDTQGVAHLGTWELSAFSHAIMSAPMGVVVRPLDNQRLDAFVERRRGLSGNRLIGKRDFARPILQALRRNEAVGILVDQNVVPEAGAFVDFFGTLACSGTTFAKIAARSGAGVIPGFAFWSDEEQRHILHFYPEVVMTGDLTADTAAIQKAVENAIRERPDQWLWIHRRWKTRPAGEPPIY